MTDLLFDIGPSDVASTSDDYYTPRWIFDAAGLVFDLDVAAPVDPARRTCPARRYLTPVEDGLAQPWEGLVWMNPPYSAPRLWVDRFVQHHHGLALLPTPKGTPWLGSLLRCADSMTLLTVDFGRPDGSKGALPYLLILAGCGPVAADAVGRVAAADKYVRGAYHVRPG
jgi:hypothetical protein